MAKPSADRPLPVFPAILKSAEIDGEVRLHYVVDAAGRAVPGSLVIDKSSHELFSYSVRKALPSWVFSPAQLHGRRVSVRYDEVFVFRASHFRIPAFSDDHAVALDSIDVPALVRDTTSDGVPRTLIGILPRRPLPPGRFSGSDLLAAQRAALAAIAETDAHADAPGRGIVTLCVSILRDTTRVPADTQTLRGLERPGRRAVVPRECPHTYSSMVMVLDSTGRPVAAPPGWVDPFYLTVTRAAGWARDLVRVWAEVSQGTGRHGLACVVHRDGGKWSAQCAGTWFSVS